MTIRDLALFQFNSFRSSPSNNIMTLNSQQQIHNVSSSSHINRINKSNSNSLQFLNQYKSKIDGLKSAAGKIRSLSMDSVWSNLKITSSDEAVVSNATAYGRVPQRAEYDIEVLQLAQRQISAIDTQDIDFSQNGSFDIQFTGDNN